MIFPIKCEWCGGEHDTWVQFQKCVHMYRNGPLEVRLVNEIANLRSRLKIAHKMNCETAGSTCECDVCK